MYSFAIQFNINCAFVLCSQQNNPANWRRSVWGWGNERCGRKWDQTCVRADHILPSFSRSCSFISSAAAAATQHTGTHTNRATTTHHTILTNWTPNAISRVSIQLLSLSVSVPRSAVYVSLASSHTHTPKRPRAHAIVFVIISAFLFVRCARLFHRLNAPIRSSIYFCARFPGIGAPASQPYARTYRRRDAIRFD